MSVANEQQKKKKKTIREELQEILDTKENNKRIDVKYGSQPSGYQNGWIDALKFTLSKLPKDDSNNGG